MGRTIAETLDGEPGVAQRTMGPAPARPVLRGLSGHRLAVLEDGGGTGDLSASAPDHAVVIDALSSSSVDVIRGPDALMLGSNTLAGVIDVRRERIPRVRPSGVTGSWTMQGESVLRGGASTLSLAGPAGPLAWRLEASGRRAGDLATPIGRLGNSWQTASEWGGGLSWLGRSLDLGVSASRTDIDYGIPGGFLGGHPNGVDLELQREHSAFVLAWRPPALPVDAVEAAWRWSRYAHRELESTGACGVRFGVLTGEGEVRTRWSGAGDWGDGEAALTGEYRDQAQGCLSFTPPTREIAGAAALRQSWSRGRWAWRAAVRADHRVVTPSERDSNKAGVIRERRFAGLSAGLSTAFDVATDWTVTLSAIKSFQAPNPEELFAEGPHLAAYTYEIGNADLEPEHGIGLEARVRWAVPGRDVTLTGFVNRIDGYLFPQDTGALEVGPGENGLLSRFRLAGLDAGLWGAETEMRWAFTPTWSAEASVSLVQGALRDTRRALPQIPPVAGRLSLRATRGAWSASVMAEGAASQHRLAEYEAATAGWLIANAQLQWSRAWRGLASSVVATLENAGDAEYRQHLSRLRSVMPEAGRSLKLLYRVQW